MESKIHSGHRERLKKQFLKSGLSFLEAHQVLELLLFYSIPRKDTNPLAHTLLNTFGDLPHVLDAPVEDLCRIDGISEHSAILLNLCGKLLPRYQMERQNSITSFSCIEETGAFLQSFFLNEPKEKSVVLFLNNRFDLLGYVVLSTGTLTGTSARAREIAELAIRKQATGVVLSHNHPAGFAVPSSQDLQTTQYLIRALKLMEITLWDHLIFSNCDYISLRQSPRFSSVFLDSEKNGDQ